MPIKANENFQIKYNRAEYQLTYVCSTVVISQVHISDEFDFKIIMKNENDEIEKCIM